MEERDRVIGGEREPAESQYVIKPSRYNTVINC